MVEMIEAIMTTVFHICIIIAMIFPMFVIILLYKESFDLETKSNEFSKRKKIDYRINKFLTYEPLEVK